MNVSSRSLLAFFVVLAVSAAAWAVEKNGFMVTVTKVTLDRADQRGGLYSYDRINRTQGLKLSIKNTSFSAMPEGEVQWQILNRKHDSTRVELTSGKEKLKALRPAETADLSIGAAEVTGYRDISETSMDKLEWQVTILQAGKEVLKTASTASFDVVAKRATKITAPAR